MKEGRGVNAGHPRSAVEVGRPVSLSVASASSEDCHVWILFGEVLAMLTTKVRGVRVMFLPDYGETYVQQRTD